MTRPIVTDTCNKTRSNGYLQYTSVEFVQIVCYGYAYRRASAQLLGDLLSFFVVGKTVFLIVNYCLMDDATRTILLNNTISQTEQ